MMAKAKKTAAPAIIPAAEIPYTVPANWRWVRLGTVLEVSKEKTEDFSDATIKYVGLENLENGRGITSYGTAEGIKSVKNVFHPGQILYGKLRPNLNKHDIAVCDGVCSSDILVFDAKAEVDTRFANFFLDRPEFVSYAVNHSKGINLPRVSVQAVLDAAFPLPPRAEQERIVAVIEELFEKLDAAEEKLRAVIEGSPARRAALLRRAFTGDLTASWRAAHGRTMDMWEKRSFGNCIDKMQNGLSKRRGVEGELYGVLRLANLGTDDICTEDLREILLTKKEQEKYSLHANDVVMIRVNGSKGNVARQLLIKSEQKWAFCDHIIRIRYKTDVVNPEYMILFSQSHEYKQYIAENMVSSAGQNTISRKGMENLIVPVPSLEEQKQMVHIFNAFISDEDEARAVAEAALAKIPALRQAVLARAFRGQLGTNDPAEPPALSE